MTHILGQSPDAPCPVCNLNPVGLVEIPVHPHLAECARCGVAYLVLDNEGDRLPRALCAVQPAYLPAMRTYYTETGRKLGPPPSVLDDPSLLDHERLARMRALDEWFQTRPEVLATPAAVVSWPFGSLTLVVAMRDEERTFQIVAPPGGLQQQPYIPIEPGELPVGTIVTISIPLVPVEPETTDTIRIPVGHA